jgi:lysine-N-methylase
MHLIHDDAVVCPPARPVRRQERRLRKTRLILPEYSKSFRCIGPACEDICCEGWNVTIDQATYEKYQTIPAGPLRVLIDANIVRTPENAAGLPPAAFALVRLQPPLRVCPFLSAERLCQIQVEHGESYLSKICSTFPRIQHTIDKQLNTSLSLACPEAARLVLLNPGLLAESIKNAKQIALDEAAADAIGPRSWFWPLREFALGLIRNRAYPLWQRMFLLGTFCRRLDAINHGKHGRGISALLRDFSAAVGSGSLRASMETIPADLTLQLDILVELVRLNMDSIPSSPRFHASLKEFVKGAFVESETARDKQVAKYDSSYQRYYAPFFEKHPYILENYLINTIFNELFPYGTRVFDPAATQDPERQYTVFATKFALIKGLLIGVAGCHQEAFSTAHVVQTIQAVFKHFEHNPKHLDMAYQLLASKKLDNAHGLTMLLRN